MQVGVLCTAYFWATDVYGRTNYVGQKVARVSQHNRRADLIELSKEMSVLPGIRYIPVEPYATIGASYQEGKRGEMIVHFLMSKDGLTLKGEYLGPRYNALTAVHAWKLTEGTHIAPPNYLLTFLVNQYRAQIDRNLPSRVTMVWEQAPTTPLAGDTTNAANRTVTVHFIQGDYADVKKRVMEIRFIGEFRIYRCHLARQHYVEDNDVLVEQLQPISDTPK